MFDIIILILLIIAFISGLIRGFIREIGSLIAILTGLLGAILFGPWLAGIMPKLGIPEAFRIIGFSLLIFIVAMILVTMMFAAVRKAVAHGPVKIMDRLLGGLFGILKGALTIVLIIAVLLVSPLCSKIEAKSRKGPLIAHFHAAAKPIARRYLSKMAGVFGDESPPEIKNTNKKVDKDLTELINTLQKAKTDDERRRAVSRLSPEARNFIQELAVSLESNPGSKHSTAAPSTSDDWVWLSDQVSRLTSSAIP